MLDDRPLEPEELANHKRYHALAHGVQTAIAFAMANDPTYRATEPKHMRVGVDMGFVQNGALLELLIGTGVITRAQWFRALADATEREVEMREREQMERTGLPVRFR